MKKRKLNGAEAVFGFMGWLTSRVDVSGPFSGCHNAAEAAELCAEFCKANGLVVKRNSKFYRILKHPTDKTYWPQRP